MEYSKYVHVLSTTTRLFLIRPKQFPRCNGPAWQKTCQQNSFCVEWYDIHREYNTTFGWNEEKVLVIEKNCAAAIILEFFTVLVLESWVLDSITGLIFYSVF